MTYKTYFLPVRREKNSHDLKVMLTPQPMSLGAWLAKEGGTVLSAQIVGDMTRNEAEHHPEGELLVILAKG